MEQNSLLNKLYLYKEFHNGREKNEYTVLLALFNLLGRYLGLSNKV